MITEDYVSFEIAKLLKEKGFEPPHDYRKWLPNLYTDNGEIKWGVWSDDWYPRITLQMAMKWLREIHNIIITVRLFNSAEHFYLGEPNQFTIDVATTTMSSQKGHIRAVYSTYEEACEEAIKYCLENLV